MFIDGNVFNIWRSSGSDRAVRPQSQMTMMAAGSCTLQERRKGEGEFQTTFLFIAMFLLCECEVRSNEK